VAFEDAAGCPACLSPPGRRGEEEMRKKANEEAMLEQKAKEEALKNEALGFYHLIRQQFGLEPFDGVTIDLHAKKQAVVFDPKTETLTTVENGELTQFLKSLNVRRVLIDALFPSNAEILIDISNAGMEVYFLRRTSAPKQFKKFIKRKAEKLKLKIAIPKKNDYVDAVILSLIKPKFLQKVDADYLTCWQKMVDWRNVNEASMYLQTNFKKKTKLVNLLKEATRLQQETAKEFVDVVRFHFPKVEDIFARFRMADDITKAFCCEVYLEMLPCKTFADVLKKAGIDVSQKTHFTKEKFIYDGKFRHALDQLTLKVRRLNPHNKKHKQRIPVETILLAKEIWLMLEEERKQKGDGRVGEALGWMSRASRKRGFLPLNPPLRGLLLSQEQRTVRSGPGPRP
jgi:hypothetical protein